MDDITILYTTKTTFNAGQSLSLGLRGDGIYLIMIGGLVKRELTEDNLVSEVIMWMEMEDSLALPEWIELDAFISSYIDESKWVLAALEQA